jgi:Cu(I)/Ag(I) efflux system membrane fusion protein
MKTTKSHSLLFLLVGLIIGTALSFALLNSGWLSSLTEAESNSAEDDNKPLYWVAPMDANFRRDKPGLSPMGMELVPVYESNKQVGVVSISAEVVNNLGVRTANVISDALQVPIDTVGYIHYNEDKLIHIHPRVEGWVDRLYVKSTGDQVTAGQALYALYSPQLVNAQEDYLLALSRQNRKLIEASADRLKALHVSQSTIQEVAKSGKVKQTVTFYAEISGVLDNLNIREGFYVQPGTTMMSIGSLEEVWVEAEIFERQVSQVAQGQLVTMGLDYLPGKTWQGKVDYIYPTLEPITRTARVRLRFQNTERLLKPNMFAQVRIYTSTENNSLLVPTESVIRTGSQDRVVLAIGQGRFKSVAVNLGRVTPKQTEILSGLVLGDRVVTSAHFLLDSESSIDSDFLRMDSAMSDSIASVTGVINNIELDSRMVNVTRGPIEKWSRPSATLDFFIDPRIDLSKYSKGQSIQFSFDVSQPQFVIIHMRDIRHD